MAIIPDISHDAPGRMMNGAEVVGTALGAFTHWDFGITRQDVIGKPALRHAFTAPDGTQWTIEVRPVKTGSRNPPPGRKPYYR